MKKKTRLMAAAALGLAMTTGGCAGVTGLAPATQNAKLVKGPPITDINTPFDDALSCLRGKINPNLTFAVGAIIDQTGKEQLTEGGAGKFVTQGAGDMVQSALFRAGVNLVNRRDPRVIMNEIKWRIRDPRTLVPAAFHITGSINSLDFIPGGGADVSVAGFGPHYRQNRILVGLDLALTQTASGKIVAIVPLQKQIFAEEFGVGIGRFFGRTLVNADGGVNNREMLNFALRQMLNLATYELLTQVMPPPAYQSCQPLIDDAYAPSNMRETKAQPKPAPAAAKPPVKTAVYKPPHTPAAQPVPAAAAPRPATPATEAAQREVAAPAGAAPADTFTLDPDAPEEVAPASVPDIPGTVDPPVPAQDVPPNGKGSFSWEDGRDDAFRARGAAISGE